MFECKKGHVLVVSREDNNKLMYLCISDKNTLLMLKCIPMFTAYDGA